MANEKYFNGKAINIFIQRDDVDDTPVLVGCWTENGFSITKTPVNTANKCNNGWNSSGGGTGAWEMTGTGDAIDETGEASRVSYQTLLGLSITGEEFFVKMANADGTYYRAGRAIITSYSESAPVAEKLTFQVTFQGQGEPEIVETT